MNTLNQALDQAKKAGCIIPCQLDPQGWCPGEDKPLTPTTARLAIDWCHACPVLQECRQWAHGQSQHHEDSRVIGGEWWSEGHTRNPIPQRTRNCAACGYLFAGRHLNCPTCRRVSTVVLPQPSEAA